MVVEASVTERMPDTLLRPNTPAAGRVTSSVDRSPLGSAFHRESHPSPPTSVVMGMSHLGHLTRRSRRSTEPGRSGPEGEPPPTPPPPPPRAAQLVVRCPLGRCYFGVPQARPPCDESDCRGAPRLTLRRACSCGSPVRSLTAGARRTTHAEGSMLAGARGRQGA